MTTASPTHRRHAPHDPDRVLVTPEGVALHLQIGEAGQRATALFIDALIVFGIMLLISVGLGVIAVSARRLGAVTGQAAEVLWLVGFFLLRNFYFVAFELGPRGGTPGKRMAGLRVCARDGGRLTAEAIFARNALRELELYLPLTFLFAGAATRTAVDGWMYLAAVVWALIFLLFPLFNRDRLRMGDLVAGTWVVRAPRRKLLADLSTGAAHDRFAFTPAQVEAYGVKELHVLEEVLRGKDVATKRAVAGRIRRKIGWNPQPIESDAEFLSAYYAALRQRLEQRLLFGKRRIDKHDV